MRVAVFSTKQYDRSFLAAANRHRHEFVYHDARLTPLTAALAQGCRAVCAFVNDQLSEETLTTLRAGGTELIALRSAGFNNVDLAAAERLGMTVARVPAYSPHAVAEHAVALVLSLNRHTCRAWNRVREGNFSLEGLLGFDLYGKTVGVIGTGRIGIIFAQIMHGFGCCLLAHDPYPNAQAPDYLGYVSLDELLGQADIVSVHCPLTPQTEHLIDEAAIARMKDGVMLINTSRGRVVDSRALLGGLKSGKIGFVGLDVYEEEENLFFQDLSDRPIADDLFMRLTTFPNVLITGHQGFFTREALHNIATVTLDNITAFETGQGEVQRVGVQQIAARE
ncbi:MAG TPA: 2-hydroxyacid dehydrogenase [Noviherbaspirillum sp.]